jgi:hypothetical protein
MQLASCKLRQCYTAVSRQPYAAAKCIIHKNARKSCSLRVVVQKSSVWAIHTTSRLVASKSRGRRCGLLQRSSLGVATSIHLVCRNWHISIPHLNLDLLVFASLPCMAPPSPTIPLPRTALWSSFVHSTPHIASTSCRLNTHSL